MAAAMLCGDEISSAVVDIGGAFCKFGTAGQDSPPHVFRSDVGRVEREQEHSQQGRSDTEYTIGDSELRVVRSGVDVAGPYSSGGISFLRYC